jgi:hypothetical protein
MIEPSMPRVVRASVVSLASVLAVGLVAGALVTACHPAPTARERVLAALPSDAVAVVVADGRALAHPRVRGVLDVLAARWPASLACLVDAAAVSDAIGVTVDRASNVTALLALPRPPRCAVLSQREPGLWIATIGAGPAAPTTPLLADPRFARARPYLQKSAIAAAVLGSVHQLAAAQPEPLDAWVAIDVPGGADAVAASLADLLGRLQREPAVASLAARLRTTRPGPGQIVVELAGPVDGDLAAAVRVALAWADAGESRAPTAAAFACPPPAGGVRCVDGTGTRYQVASLADDLAAIVSVGHPTPIVVNGLVTGLRLDAAVSGLGLRAGDVIVAMAGRVVTSRTMLADWIARARLSTTVTVRRGVAEAVLQFAER